MGGGRFAVGVEELEGTLEVVLESEAGFFVDCGVGEGLENLLQRSLTHTILRHPITPSILLNKPKNLTNSLPTGRHPKPIIPPKLLQHLHHLKLRTQRLYHPHPVLLIEDVFNQVFRAQFVVFGGFEEEVGAEAAFCYLGGY